VKCYSEMKKAERDRLCAQCLNLVEKEKRYFKNGKTIITFGTYALANLLLTDPFAVGMQKI